MKTLTFNRKSWHYQFADKGGYWPRQDLEGNYVGDICEYTVAVIKFFLVFIMLAAVGTLVAIPIVHMLFGIIFSLWYGVFLMTEVGMVGVALTVAMLCVGLMLWSIMAWQDRKQRLVNGNDSFMSNAYRSWKEKYCVKITFTE
jgi:hypothetical protein